MDKENNPSFYYNLTSKGTDWEEEKGGIVVFIWGWDYNMMEITQKVALTR